MEQTPREIIEETQGDADEEAEGEEEEEELVPFGYGLFENSPESYRQPARGPVDPDYPLARTLILKACLAGFRLKERMGNFFYYTLIFEKP